MTEEEELDRILTVKPLDVRATEAGIPVSLAFGLRRLDARIVDRRTWAGEGVARVLAWHDAGRPAPDLDRLAFVGDREIELAVRGVLSTIPHAVAWHAIRNVVFVGSGVSSRGFRAALPPAPPEGEGELIALSRAEPSTVAHELGHTWTMARPFRMEWGADLRWSAAADDGRAGAVVRRGDSAVEAWVARACMLEMLADDCARAWGFFRPEVRRRDLEERFRRELLEGAKRAAGDGSAEPEEAGRLAAAPAGEDDEK